MLSTAASFNTQLFSLNNFNYVKPLPPIQTIPPPVNFTNNTLTIINQTGSNIFKNGTYIATQSSIAENRPAWGALCGSTSNFWHCAYPGNGAYTQFPYDNADPYASYVGGGSGFYQTTIVDGATYAGEWIQVKTPYKYSLTSYSLYPREGGSWSGRGFKKFYVVGSNDGITWSLVDSQDLATPPTQLLKTFDLPVVKNNTYSYYRLIVNKLFSGGSGVVAHISQWNLFGTNYIPSSWSLIPNFNIINTSTNKSFYNCACDNSMNTIISTYGDKNSYFSDVNANYTNYTYYTTDKNTFTIRKIVTTGTNNSSFVSISSNGQYILYGNTKLFLSTTGPNGTYNSILTTPWDFISGFISDDGQTILALNFIGLYKSTNGGSTFNYYNESNAYRFSYQQNYKKSLACSKNTQYVMCIGLAYTADILYFNMTTNTFTNINTLTNSIYKYGYPLNCSISSNGKCQVFCTRLNNNANYGNTYKLYYHNNYGINTDFTLILQNTNTNSNTGSTTNLDYGPLVACVSSDGTCIGALFTTTLRITKDEGATWSIINLPITTTTLSDINYNNYDMCMMNYYFLINIGLQTTYFMIGT